MPAMKRLARAARRHARQLANTPGAKKLRRETGRIFVVSVAGTVAGLCLIVIVVHRITNVMNQPRGKK